MVRMVSSELAARIHPKCSSCANAAASAWRCDDRKDAETDAHQHRQKLSLVEDQQLTGESKYSAHA
jgi:hypothetical protein